MGGELHGRRGQRGAARRETEASVLFGCDAEWAGERQQESGAGSEQDGGGEHTGWSEREGEQPDQQQLHEWAELRGVRGGEGELEWEGGHEPGGWSGVSELQQEAGVRADQGAVGGDTRGGVAGHHASAVPPGAGPEFQAGDGWWSLELQSSG